MRNRHRVMAAGALLAICGVLAATFAVRAKADDVTNDNLGRTTETFVYADRNPNLGVYDVSAWGTKFDSDGDDDNDADKHRAQGLAVKRHPNVLRLAIRARLQRFINDANGPRWVTATSSALINSGNTAQSVRAASPIIPFKCYPINATDPVSYRYRAVTSGGVRYRNNYFEHFEEISRPWRATGPRCSL